MIIYHRLVQRDLSGILSNYTDVSGQDLADRFFKAFIATVLKAEKNPDYFHPVEQEFRRGIIPNFPYHFLYRKVRGGIKVLVLRHHSRKSSLGMKRR